MLDLDAHDLAVFHIYRCRVGAFLIEYVLAVFLQLLAEQLLAIFMVCSAFAFAFAFFLFALAFICYAIGDAVAGADARCRRGDGRHGM